MTTPVPEMGTEAAISRVHDETGLSPDIRPAGSASAAPGSAAQQLSGATAGVEAKLKQQQRPLVHGKEGESRARPSDIMVAKALSSSPPRNANLESAFRSSSPFQGAVSPGRSSIMRSSSPRHLSPATSQIFERDVVDPTVAPELSPAIPAHIQTEDHIPPVLEASSLALTDDHLGQDDIEIVTHTAHEPAAVAMTGSTSNLAALSDSAPHLSSMSSLNELAAPSSEHDAESSSVYGVVDPADPRRLSFISFADVVHSEHQEVGHGPHPLSMSSTAPSVAGDRSPEPVRSPVLAGGSPPPPPPAVGSTRVGESSPVRGAAAPSIASSHEIRHGELTIETMRHAIQKTGSNNETVGIIGSAPTSAVGDEGQRFPPS